MTRNMLITWSLALALFAGTPLALAQQSQGGYSDGQAAPDTPSTIDPTRDDLRKFVVAEQEIQAIRDEYRSEIQSTNDQQQAVELQQQANQEMIRAVNETGLTVREFNAIVEAANQDSELADTLRELRDSGS